MKNNAYNGQIKAAAVLGAVIVRQRLTVSPQATDQAKQRVVNPHPQGRISSLIPHPAGNGDICPVI